MNVDKDGCGRKGKGICREGGRQNEEREKERRKEKNGVRNKREAEERNENEECKVMKGNERNKRE